MKFKDRIVKQLMLVDLEHGIEDCDNPNNQKFLTMIKNYDLPDEFKKIIIVISYVAGTYKKTYELITEYPVIPELLLFPIQIGENTYVFSACNDNSYKVAKRFYKEIIDAGYFEKYIDFLNELFMIKDKEYMETYINNDKKSNKKLLKRKMKREVIK